jgi:Protein of unknown function (DUF3293)
VAPAPEDRWASYERTVIEIVRPGEGILRVRSAPAPDADADGASWPWPDGQPVHLLTAWDPGLERPGHDVNRVRQAALEADLARLSVPLLAAVGVDPASGRREEGVAVRGLPEAEALALALRYGQDAVFAWTPAEWAIVSCRGDRRLASGWSLVSEPGFRFSRASDTPI